MRAMWAMPRTGVRGCELWLLVSREDPKAASHKFGDRLHCVFPSRLRVFAASREGDHCGVTGWVLTECAPLTPGPSPPAGARGD
ncbi:MAG: hypothetical protein ACK5TG_10685, partial [Planctomyces sp.]